MNIARFGLVTCRMRYAHLICADFDVYFKKFAPRSVNKGAHCLGRYVT